MTTVSVSNAARDDLKSIWEYTKGRWGEVQADSYVRELDAGMQELATFPSMGERCELVREGYRRVAKGEHHIYYRQDAGTVLVARVLGQCMQIEDNDLEAGEGHA